MSDYGTEPVYAPKPSLWARIHATMAKIPLKAGMGILSILVSALLVPVIILDIISLKLDPLHWIVSGYILAGVVLVIMASVPIACIRDLVLRWFLFLATFNGKGALLFMLGLLATGMGLWGILAGIANMVVAVLHILLWLFFRDLVSDEVQNFEQRARMRSGHRDTEAQGSVNTRNDIAEAVVAQYFSPKPAHKSATSSSKADDDDEVFGPQAGAGQGGYGTYGGYSTTDPYHVAQPYSAPSYDEEDNPPPPQHQQPHQYSTGGNNEYNVF